MNKSGKLFKALLSSPTKALYQNGGRCLSTVPPEMPSVDFSAPPYEGPDYSMVREIKKKNLNPALVPYFRDPVLMHAGKMQWLFDHTGKRYLDLFAGIVTVSVGHCHPKVVEAATQQMKKLWHTTNIYMHPKIHEYAEKLAELLPGNLKVVYLVNSGSEANDLAMLMSRLYTGAFDIIGLRNGYHGTSLSTVNLTGFSNYKFNLPISFGVHHANNPDTYQGIRGGYRDSPVQSLRASESVLVNDECSSADFYVDQLKEVLHYSIAGGRPAAFFAEAIQGVGGATQFPKGYLKKAFALVRQHGGVCVSDEVQTGFGRTGEYFWGFEGHGVVPDIVTLAKGIGNGFPLGAVVTTPEIAQVMSRAMHFNTYGGNPIASAVGLAVLEAIKEDKIQENCSSVGTQLLKGLEKFRDNFEIVGDVRGKGLMIGMEMVEDKESRTPLNSEKFFDIWESCRDMGILLGRGGRYGNVFRIKPPMCITKEDADFALATMSKALQMHT